MVKTQKIRITGMRPAPPTRDVDAYYADKRATQEAADPAKPTGPARRTFADETYRGERGKTKARERVPSAERDVAREIRRSERDLREQEGKSKRGHSKEPETFPDHLKPPTKVKAPPTQPSNTPQEPSSGSGTPDPKAVPKPPPPAPTPPPFLGDKGKGKGPAMCVMLGRPAKKSEKKRRASIRSYHFARAKIRNPSETFVS